MKDVRAKNTFVKDLRRAQKRRYDISLIHIIIDQLRRGSLLPPASRDHLLKGEWKGWRECHIQPDWLLIYKTSDTELLLARTGTHADLFGN